MKYSNYEDTICAISTGGSTSAIAIIRVSGKKSLSIVNSIFNKDILEANSHTIHLGNIIEEKNIIDEVLVSIFQDNKSFTGETTLEISCHGSTFIQNKIIHLLLDKGCRLATSGEFTMRAFKNGKLDLSQAESIADLISSKNKKSHEIAINQMKGGISNILQDMRKKLIDFSSLMELELDFSEEDVEFVDSKQLKNLLKEIKDRISELINSFELGNAIKNGIPIAILGESNVGKSTLLNTLLDEDKAIVSDIAGTTRDTIEATLIINDISFRFIDTAGIRTTNDEIESLGIKKSFKKGNESEIILFVLDASQDIKDQKNKMEEMQEKFPNTKLLTVINKIDLIEQKNTINNNQNEVYISAKNRLGIDLLKNKIIETINLKATSNHDIIITNLRHYESLNLTLNEINIIINSLSNDVPKDLISTNIRQALFHLGNITGEISNDDILENIFSKFCIGK